MNDLNQTPDTELNDAANEASTLFFADYDASYCSPARAYAEGYKAVMIGDRDEDDPEVNEDTMDATKQFFAEERHGENFSPNDAFEAGFKIAVTCLRLANKDAAVKAAANVVAFPSE